MVERSKRKKNRLRGHRSHGKGNTKNRRGAGCRGGRGRAGSKKHKRTLYYETIGNKVRLKKQFVAKGRKQPQALNLDDLNYLVEGLVKREKIEKQGDLYLLDGDKIGLDKVLSRGKLEHKVLLKNVFASKAAVKKIEESGSKIELKEGGEIEEKIEEPKTEGEGE